MQKDKFSWEEINDSKIQAFVPYNLNAYFNRKFKTAKWIGGGKLEVNNTDATKRKLCEFAAFANELMEANAKALADKARFSGDATYNKACTRTQYFKVGDKIAFDRAVYKDARVTGFDLIKGIVRDANAEWIQLDVGNFKRSNIDNGIYLAVEMPTVPNGQELKFKGIGYRKS